MTAAHFPFSPFYNPLLFQTSSSHNQLSYFLVFSVRNSVKQSILHLFICVLLLGNSQLFLRQDALMKGIAGNFELGSDCVKAVDEGIHVELLPALLAFPHDSVEHLAFA